MNRLNPVGFASFADNRLIASVGAQTLTKRKIQHLTSNSVCSLQLTILPFKHHDSFRFIGNQFTMSPCVDRRLASSLVQRLGVQVILVVIGTIAAAESFICATLQDYVCACP